MDVMYSVRKDSNSMHALRAGNERPHRISGHGASRRPFSVSEKCGAERRTEVGENLSIYVLNIY